MSPPLVAMSVTDSPSTWSRLGFVVADDATVTISGVRFHLQGNENDDDTRSSETTPARTRRAVSGLTGWTFHDPTGSLPDSIDGIATTTVLERVKPVSAQHPNGVTAIDHVVLRTHNLDRTVATLESLGMACRRRRDVGSNGSSVTQQAFFWLGSPNDPDDRVVLEVVGQSVVDPQLHDKPSTFFGIALVCEDLDATAAFFGDLVKPPIDAVQKGRRITAISARGGSSVAIALMTPHVKPSTHASTHAST